LLNLDPLTRVLVVAATTAVLLVSALAVSQSILPLQILPQTVLGQQQCSPTESYPVTPNPYTITARTLAQAKAQFQVPGGHAALTRSGVVQLSQTTFDSMNRITCTNVIVPITQRFPKWNNNDCRSCIQTEWNRFMERLMQVHEQGHIDLIVDAYDGFGAGLIGKTLDEARQLAAAIDPKLQNDHDRYDDCRRGTCNGATEGAVLDINACPCPAGQTDCCTKCSDLRTDNDNCGACGTSCSNTPFPVGAICQNGQCVCPSGSTLQNGRCECPPDQDLYLGICLLKCTGGQIHTGLNGECRCPFGYQLRDGQCRRPTFGGAVPVPSCNPPCDTTRNFQCINGSCQCPSGWRQINGWCRPPGTCGGCASNSDCPAGTVCTTGTTDPGTKRCYSYTGENVAGGSDCKDPQGRDTCYCRVDGSNSPTGNTICVACRGPSGGFSQCTDQCAQ
jgi:Cys-rich repeat protein